MECYGLGAMCNPRVVLVAASLVSSLALAEPPGAPSAPSPGASTSQRDTKASAEGTTGEGQGAAEGADDVAEAALPPGMTPGPSKVKLGSQAELDVAEGAVFGDGEATRKVLEQSGNLTSGREVGILLKGDSAVIFEFDPSGYVKDDDKESLDADAMLKSIREGQEEANEELKRLGRPELEIPRWQVTPHYEPKSHNLEWGPVIKSKENGHETVNYNVRLLGRRGVMEVTLLVPPERLEEELPWFRSALTGFRYVEGEDYASFRQGDKVAAYGLAALVTGGAVAVAAKSGLLGKLWKVIVVGVLGALAALKRLFTSKRGGGEAPETKPPTE